MTTRTGQIGNCYEYRTNGTRMAGTDRMTIDGMLRLSKDWPYTYHQYIGTNDYQTWAKGGREISVNDLPRELR